MFTEGYFWYCIAAYFFAFIMDRVASRDVMLPDSAAGIMKIVSLASTVARYIFLILGFWAMPHWWYPLAIWGCSFLVALIPIGDKIAAYIGIIAAPVFTVLMYLDLYNVI